MKSYLLIFAFVLTGFSYPMDGPSEPEIGDAEELVEGDMILTPEQKEILYGETNTRNGIKDSVYRWPGAVVHYQFRPSVPNSDRQLIRSSLNEIERVTCVRFKLGANSQGNFIGVQNNETGCSAKVGYLRVRGQRLNLGPNCMRKGTIIHEFLHAIGFYHQQSASERDSFVTINWENIEPKKEGNFKKYTNSEVTNFGIGYDYGSIMHYGAFFFSNNGQPTITAKKPGGEKMGQRAGLSTTDIQKINRMYNCRAT